MLRKTKIVCTLGPSTDDENVMRSLIEEGMNVARFNFSHGGHEEQFGRLTMLRKLREEMKRPVAALLDTKGPEIRLKEFASGKVELKNGQTFTLTTEDIVGDESRVAITYKDLPDDVKPGDTILIDDGLIGLEVKKIQKVSGTKADAEGKMPMDIVCTVMNGGMVSNKKGVNVPNVELSMPYISEKDYGDIVFAVENDYDFIAASFVRCADDVLAIRKILEEKGGEDIHIIATPDKHPRRWWDNPGRQSGPAGRICRCAFPCPRCSGPARRCPPRRPSHHTETPAHRRRKRTPPSPSW